MKNYPVGRVKLDLCMLSLYSTEMSFTATFSNGTVNSKHAGELNADILARPNCTNLRLKEHRIMVTPLI